MHLRPHHLLCLLGFRGLGYSPEFVENLSAVAQRLRRCPETEVTLVEGADSICRACPRVDGEGACGPAPHAKDDAIRERLGARAGERRAWSEWQSRVAAAFDAPAQAEACGECRWLGLGYCREGLLALRRQCGVEG